jgi:hypothetical protein
VCGACGKYPGTSPDCPRCRRILQMQRLASEGRDLTTGEPAPDYAQKCRRCGVRTPREGKYLCSACRDRVVKRKPKQEVQTINDVPKIPVGGVAAAERINEPAQGKQEVIVMKKYDCGNPSKNPKCSGTTTKPGGLCRSCGIRAGKAARTGAPEGRPAAKAPDAEIMARTVRTAAFRFLTLGASANKESVAVTCIEKALTLLRTEDILLDRPPISLIDGD